MNCKDGKPVIETDYDPALLNWNEAIERALAERGLKHGEATVICIPVTAKARMRVYGSA